MLEASGIAPTVSVVIAAYNRSDVLRHAIGSVIDSTFTDWELLVIGDHCTDDSEACVKSFGDDRIRFYNLPQNCGDQSGPNNTGLELARGKYVAFLNQDDLYFPDHLASCIAALETADADLVWSACVAAYPDRTSRLAPTGFALIGVPSARGYDSFEFYSASSWMLRRDMAKRIGPWPHPDSVFVTTSQAWLFRAWRTGAKLRFVENVGVVLVWSGARKGSYEERQSKEHGDIAARLRGDPRFREQIFEKSAISERIMFRTARRHEPAKNIALTLLYPVYAVLTWCGVHPLSLDFLVRFGGKGGFLRRHRRYTRSHISNDKPPH